MKIAQKKLKFPPLPALTSNVRAVYFEPIALSGERYCIAVVGSTSAGDAIARSAVSPRVARCVIGELGANLVGFSQLVVQDFQFSISHGISYESWAPPFDRMYLGECRDIDGDTPEQILQVATMTFAMLAHETESDLAEQSIIIPSADDERQFRDSVRHTVEQVRPGLARYFGQTFSLTGGRALNRIDYMSASYGVCYSTINPYTAKANLMPRAQAALWRLARARDASGFTPPTVLEIVLWTPQPGQPIFSRQHYDIVDETVAELRSEAERDDLGVMTVFTPDSAGERLLSLENA